MHVKMHIIILRGSLLLEYSTKEQRPKTPIKLKYKPKRPISWIINESGKNRYENAMFLINQL